MSSPGNPAQSQQFEELERNLREIEDLLLPEEKIDGSYTEREKMLIRSYRMLSHAEFEYYFEKIAELTITKAHNEWITTRKASNVLTSLASFSHIKLEIPKMALGRNGRPNKGTSCEERLILAKNKFIEQLNDNHGIKQKDLLKILLPIGLSMNEIDNTWLIAIDSFGSKRGTIAHCSIKVQIILDPVTERNDIDAMLNGIRDLDQKICSLD